MKDLLSAVWSGLGAAVYAWTWPSALFVGFCWLVYLPHVEQFGPFAPLMAQPVTNKIAVYVASSIILGLFLLTVSEPLTRTLEGYYIVPSRLRGWMLRRERDRWESIWSKIADADPSELHEVAVAQEKLNHYPRDEALIMPTRLGNALRAGESYGWIQYGISVPDLWVHMTCLADSAVRDALNEARVRVDLHIALVWVSTAGALLAVPVAIAGAYATVFWVPVLAILAYVFYRRAVRTTSWYTRAMWALVDTARTPLAEGLGLELPGSIEEERALWEAISNYATWGPGWPKTEAWITTIDGALRPRGSSAEKE